MFTHIRKSDTYANAARKSYPAIIVQPPTEMHVTSAPFTVHVQVQGKATFKWQYQSATGTTWANSTAAGNTTDTLTIATIPESGMKYRCRVTADSGVGTVNSEVCTVIVD